jgi:hypothetical protein
MNKTQYPLHPSLKNALRTMDAPLLAARLIRRLAKTLKISTDHVEVLFALAPEVNKDPMTVKAVKVQVNHLTTKQVQAILDDLTPLYAIKTPVKTTPKKTEYLYCASLATVAAIAAVEKDKLV